LKFIELNYNNKKYHGLIKDSENRTGIFVDDSVKCVTAIRLKGFAYPFASMKQIE
jgi:hypothetical protein